ncbi:MAG: YicC/YloC family endoribonuclease [Myxococcota bacterium]|nr:YicC/YloC family endoribonuclease [Myxococcota bacterium]
MAIRSMTGFGRGAGQVSSRLCVLEAKSVNHKYQDIRVRLPKWLSPLEPVIRAAFGAAFTRGRIEVSVQAAGGDEFDVDDVAVDVRLAEVVCRAHKTLAEALAVPERLDSRVLASWPGVFRPVFKTLTTEELEVDFKSILEESIESLCQMRIDEGARLQAVLEAHLDTLTVLLGRIELRRPEIIEAHQARLELRIGEALKRFGMAPDAARIVQEVALMADRTDIAEEVARLNGHFEYARSLINGEGDGGVGRKLDFLCQEMLREINTLGSKIQDLEVTRSVVDMKSELERFREQIQNVE